MSFLVKLNEGGGLQRWPNLGLNVRQYISNSRHIQIQPAAARLMIAICRIRFV